MALPNWDRFRTSLRIWPTVEYLDGPAAIAGRLGRYLADSDQALGRSLPLLLAAALGVAALARRWPRLAPETRDALVMALLTKGVFVVIPLIAVALWIVLNPFRAPGRAWRAVAA